MAAKLPFAKMLRFIIMTAICYITNAQRGTPEPTVLTPPYFNLAYERKIEATATCGAGNVGQERYCKLTGADPTASLGHDDGELIQGQLCDVCVSEELAEQLGAQDPASRPYYRNRVHSPENAVDGSERWWQSPPLSRGLQYNQVNVTVDLGQVFHVAYVFLKMANSPRPGVWALERSNDFGKTYQPWQYFADDINQCHQFFGNGNFDMTIQRDDSVICSTRFSEVVPLENGEIAVSLVNGRPSAYNFSYSPVLQEWTKATNVRLRLLETKTLYGHLMALRVDQDPTVTRRYFYSIKDISIGGRCVCNGHASLCLRDTYDPRSNERKLVCECQHNTCGDQCQECCPGFVQKPWRPATPDSSNACEPCQCYGHTTECVYDPEIARQRLSIDIHGNYEGGGVCQNCRHNTEGINCEKCAKGYYHPPGVALDDPYTCQPCNCDLVFSTGECDSTGRCLCRPQYTGPDCDRCAYGYMNWPECVPCECNLNGTLGGICEARGGNCPCKPEFTGQFCDQCAYGYWGYPNCQRCRCGGVGVLDGSCDQRTGQCLCKGNYAGTNCDQCKAGYYNFPACNLCQCDPDHTTADICDAYTGSCLCLENFSGDRCDRCEAGYYRYPYCIECGCQQPGSLSSTCDEGTGQCRCKANFAGQYCDKCAPGYYNYPECTACDCDTYGSYGKSCNQQTGQCDCRPTFMGQRCDTCRPNYYNYPNCEECNCNPEGAKPVPGYPLGGCGSVNRGVLCECKENVMGRICDTCKPGYWDLDRNNPEGCTDCGCHRPGTTGGQNRCDMENGQCVCKTFCSERRCDECADGTYNLQEYNHFGCEDCGCDVGGSVDYNCNKQTGQCTCRPRIDGTKCDRPISTHYFPTLYQHKYELEDGYTVRGGPVRYGYDERIFSGYSWRGYAVLSRLQDEVLFDIDIAEPNLFKIVYRFVNRNKPTVNGEVTMTSENPNIAPQQATVYFQATDGNTAYTTANSEVYLNSGRWTISVKSPKTLFLDYFVLIPREYYEASILQYPTYRVCRVPDDGHLCQHYVYVDVFSHPTAKGSEGYVRRGNNQERTQRFPNTNINNELGVDDMAYLNAQQTDLSMSIPVGMAGKYYLILLYYSDVDMRMQTLDVTTSGGRGDRGRLHLTACPYSSLCRQVVVDENGDAKVFDIESAYAAVTLSGQADMDIAVESIVAIPANEWDLELIQPRLKCMRRNGQCQDSYYKDPTGTAKAEFEEGPNRIHVADDIPPNIIDTTVRVVKLNGQLPQISVKASVDRPGPYVVVVHYFQPYDPGFDVHVDILTGRNPTTGSFRADYCPSVSGCRAAVSWDAYSLNGETLDLRDLDFVLTFNNSAARPIWLDYILVVPAPQFSEAVLQLAPEDRSRQFLQECATDNFNIDPASSEFCRDSVFSLTAEYNNGGLSCDCNLYGSTSFACEQFGGQCPCKANVIGRDCSRCKTGHYRFPDCLPCNCPSGLCDEQTGQCICPPRVTGDQCDQCEPLTFGFDPLIGCEDCNCDPQGVRRGNLECDINDGQCDCRRQTMGRRCDECRNGFWDFPRCLECNCNVAGSQPRICDPDTSRCLCKENVQGSQCQQCLPGTFYLEDRNPKGCTDCFCFGFTDRCFESTLRRDEVLAMNGWAISNLDRPDAVSGNNRVVVQIDPATVQDPQQPHYWIAPGDYIYNKVTSYGGKLSYTVMYEGSGAASIGPDVRIEGGGLTLVAYAFDQPDEGRETDMTVDLLETNFEHEDSGDYATREQFLTALVNLRSLQIRASYQENTARASLADVRMEIATETGRGEVARNVESCSCPRGYAGTSCERCAEGFYRSDNGGLYLGQCVPCNCNGRSNSCDPVTGECTNCRDDFEGPQCLTCKRGYYFDEYTSTCQICSCPLPIESNNFAASCEVSRAGDVLRCLCDEGYEEPDCGSCSPGYWGNPLVQGGRCLPCDCSGNIDRRDRFACDVSTGQCLRCINNATGDRCERCREWYYGDAIDLKDCAPCNCNQVGSERCDHRNGVCLCKPNVVGPTCDRCARGTFGFESGNGCQECNCASAVFSDQCDEVTGQCECKPGVTGRRCDQCQRGYYGYTADGCRQCDCTSEGAVTCDPVSGRCQCLPGVTGAKCDQCLPRWVLIPDQGCEECDNCVHTLLDDVDAMRRELNDMADNLEDVSVGQDAIRRLKAINDTVDILRPRVDDMVDVPTDAAMLEPIKDDLKEVIDLSKEVRDKGHRLAREAEVVESDAADVRTDAENLEDMVQMAVDAANDAVDYANEILQDILNGIADANVDQLVQRAEQILQQIKNRDFNDYDNRAQDELQAALDVLREAQKLHRDATDQANRTLDMAADVDQLRVQLRDLMNSSRHTQDNAQAAKEMNEETGRTIDEIEFAAKDAAEKETRARDLLRQAEALLADAENAYDDVEREGSQLDIAKQNLQNFVDDLTEENRQLDPLVKRAMDHALGLRDQADGLAGAFADAKNSAEAAINASNAYKNIVIAIDAAYNASLEAKKAGDQALDMSDGLADRAARARERSEDLKVDADDTKNYVTTQYQRLQSAEAGADAVESLNNEARIKLQRLNDGMDDLQPGDYQEQAQNALDQAMNAQMRAEAARDKIRSITQDDLARARELGELIQETNLGVEKAQQQIEDVRDLVPDITALLNNLEERQASIADLQQQVSANFDSLREKISIARGEANMIKVGVTFDESVSIQVRNPKNIMDAGGYTKVNLFFRTTEANGFLAYIGPTVDRATVKDYIALEVINGQVVFKIELGDGEMILTNPKQVNDDQWHEVIAERVGKSAKLIVRTQDEEDSVVQDTSDFEKFVLDLDAETVKFFIGGVPDNADLAGRLVSTRFVGCIEEVYFGGIPVGLWNFVEGENNNQGCYGRGKVLEAEIPPGYRFSGDGYIMLDKERFRPSRASKVEFDFRTYAEDGLMFLMGDDSFGDFFAIEMRGGKVVFQYDLGTGPAEMESAQKYNDGKWHNVYANRLNRDGLIKVDGQSASSGNSRGQQMELNINNNIYIGGWYNTSHGYRGVTNERFDGCIKSLKLGSNGRVLSDNKVILNAVPGCIDTSRVVSFSSAAGGGNSYIAMENVNIDSNFQMTLKMRSVENDGLIFYVTDDSPQQSNAFAVVMKDGKIVLVVTPGDSVSTVLETNMQYNDGGWHYITIEKQGREITLHVDDSEMVNTRYQDGKRKIETTSLSFFGGVRPGFDPVLKNTNGIQTSFYGCIGDVTINNQLVNFALVDPSNVRGVSYKNCPLSKQPFEPELIIPTRPPPYVEPRPEGPVGEEQCALSRRPDLSVVDPLNSGTRFGGSRYSRWEFNGVPSSFVDSCDFELEIKTSAEDGLLFFASESGDFITLYMEDGRLVYKFNCGSGMVELRTDFTYNDNQWHKVMFSRVGRSGTLIVGEEQETGEAPGSANALNVAPPFYVGGIDGDRLNAIDDTIVPAGITTFDGCIRNPQLNDFAFGAPNYEEETKPCTSSMETGTFFRDGPGHLELDSSFEVPQDIVFKLEIRPRTLSGVLVSVYSATQGSYLVIQMVNGDIIFSVRYDKGLELEARFQKITPAYLCDGQWHEIEAKKYKNILQLEVDGLAANTAFGPSGTSNSRTNDPLYIGGVPTRHAGIKTRGDYIGCIRNFSIDGQASDLTTGVRSNDNVILNQCPTN